MKTIEEHNNERWESYKHPRVISGNDIACPKCGSEMVDTDPDWVLTSFPPQKHVHCAWCGHKCTVFA
jgi:hypothetical protein